MLSLNLGHGYHRASGQCMDLCLVHIGLTMVGACNAQSNVVIHVSMVSRFSACIGQTVVGTCIHGEA